MYKRFISKLLIILQVYSTLFHGILAASTYDDMPSHYKVSITSSSATEFVPSFRLAAIDAASSQETGLEDISLAELASRAPMVVPEKAMTLSSDGLVWDVDGLRFMATSEGCLVIQGTSSNKTRKWVIQTASSVLLDGVDAEHFDISSPLIVTTKTTNIRCLSLKGVGANSQWFNHGVLTAKEVFLAGLWVANESQLDITITHAATAFGMINQGGFKVKSLDIGRGLLQNTALANLTVESMAFAGCIANEGVIKATKLLSHTTASIHNFGSITADSWSGGLGDFLSYGPFNCEQVDLDVKAIRSDNLLRLGVAASSGVLRVGTFESRNACAVGKLQVKISLDNQGELEFKEITGSGLVTNTRILKSEQETVVIANPMENTGSIEIAGDLHLLGQVANKNPITARDVFVKGRLAQEGMIKARKLHVDPAAVLLTTPEQSMELISLDLQGLDPVVLSGDFSLKSLSVKGKLTVNGKIVKDDQDDIIDYLEADELAVSPGGFVNAQVLKVAKSVSAAGKLLAQSVSSVGGAIIVDPKGNLALEGFIPSGTSKTIRNAGKVFIGFTSLKDHEFNDLPLVQIQKLGTFYKNLLVGTKGEIDPEFTGLIEEQAKAKAKEYKQRLFESLRSKTFQEIEDLVAVMRSQELSAQAIAEKMERIAFIKEYHDPGQTPIETTLYDSLAKIGFDLPLIREEGERRQEEIRQLAQEREYIEQQLATNNQMIAERKRLHVQLIAYQISASLSGESAARAPWTIENLGQLTIDQHLALTTGPRTIFVGETPPQTALPVSFTNAATGSLRFASGEFVNINATNADGGIVEFEAAQVWQDRFTNQGVQELKGPYQIQARGAGVHTLGKTRSATPLTLILGDATDVWGTLSRSPMQIPELNLEKPGDLTVTARTELPFALKLRLTGSFTPREILKAYILEIEANQVLGTLNLGRVISTQGLLRIISRTEFNNPESFFFGKTGLEIFAPKITHGNSRAKTAADGADAQPFVSTGAKLKSQGPIKLDTTKAPGTSIGPSTAGQGTIDVNFGDVSADGTIEIDTGTITDTAGYVYALLSGRVNATKMVVKRVDPNISTYSYISGCRGHSVTHYDSFFGSFYQVSATCGGCISHSGTTVTEQSAAGLFLTDQNLTLNVPTLEIDGSTVAASGNVIVNGRPPITTTLTAAGGIPGLTITTRSTAPSHLHGGSSIKGSVLGTANITGRITSAGAIVLGAADFLIQSIGMVDSRGTPLRLVDITAAIGAAHASGHPLLTASSAHDGRAVIDYIAPLDLVRNLDSLPMFGNTPVPTSASLGATLPLIEEFSRQMLRGLVTGRLGLNESTLRMMCANAEEFAQQRHLRAMEEESRVNGALVKFSRYPGITEADIQQAAYAMVYTKFKEGVSETTAALDAAKRHQAAQEADGDTTTIPPTLEAWLVVPAKAAPRSLTEVRGSDVTLRGEHTITVARGRETVREGDEVKGREYERHLDEAIVEATTGRVTLDAPQTVLADAKPITAQGLEITGTVVDASRPLAHHEWDHTEALRRQQEEAAMRSSMASAMGGMGSALPETAAIQFSFGAGGTRVSGFTPSSGGNWQSIENPVRREAARRAAMQEARVDEYWREFQARIAAAKPADMRSHIVPNGIIERLETHAFHMQQEHARQQFERDLEASLEEAAKRPATHDDSDSDDEELRSASSGGGSAAATSTTSAAPVKLNKRSAPKGYATEETRRIKASFVKALRAIDVEDAAADAPLTPRTQFGMAAVRHYDRIKQAFPDFIDRRKDEGRTRENTFEEAYENAEVGILLKVTWKGLTGTEISAYERQVVAECGTKWVIGKVVDKLVCKGVPVVAMGMKSFGKVVKHEVAKASKAMGKAPYDPRAMEAMLIERYGADAVSSSTLLRAAERNVKLAGQRHPETGVVFDLRGNPIFDDVAVFDTRIGRDLALGAKSGVHKQTATTELAAALEGNSTLKAKFDSAQLAAIAKGKERIPGYIWHHHQDIGRMQLIDETLHIKTGHTGEKLWVRGLGNE